MKRIQELLGQKGDQVWSISPESSVYDALERMAEKNIGALLVMEKGQLVGVLSERDYTRKGILQGRTARETAVRALMTPRPLCIAPEQTVEEAMALMTERRVRHLPVIQENQVVGLVSIGDLVKAIIAEQQFVIQQLEHYIAS